MLCMYGAHMYRHVHMYSVYICILAGLSCTGYWLHTRLTGLSGVVSLPSASSFTVSLREGGGCSVVRRRGRRSTHAWPRMAVFSSFAFLSFGRTSSRLTADQTEISYSTGEPGIFAPYQLLPLSLVQLRRSRESPNTRLLHIPQTLQPSVLSLAQTTDSDHSHPFSFPYLPPREVYCRL